MPEKIIVESTSTFISGESVSNEEAQIAITAAKDFSEAEKEEK